MEGTVRYEAQAHDSASASGTFNGIWISTIDGSTSLRTSTYAAVQFGDTQIRLSKSNIDTFEFNAPGLNPGVDRLASDEDGGLFFSGTVDDIRYGKASRALIYLPSIRIDQ